MQGRVEDSGTKRADDQDGPRAFRNQLVRDRTQRGGDESGVSVGTDTNDIGIEAICRIANRCRSVVILDRLQLSANPAEVRFGRNQLL